MKRILLSIYTILIINGTIQSQQYFQKAYGGFGYEFLQGCCSTADGGLIVCGRTTSFVNGSDDIFVIKIDSIGNQEWSKNYGQMGVDNSYCIIETFDGNFVIAGTLGGAMVMKIDPTGNIIWIVKGPGDEFFSVSEAGDHGYIACGYSAGVTTQDDVMVMKISSSGALQWTKQLGSIYDDYGQSIKQTSDSGYVIAGYTYGFGMGAGGADAYLIKLDSTGTVQWSKTYGSALTDWLYDVEETSDNGFIMCGGVNSNISSISGNGAIIRTNNLGDTLWTKKFFSIGAIWDIDVIHSSTEFVFAGWMTGIGGNMFLVKTDSLGNTLWANSFGGGGGKCYSVDTTSDDGYFIGGHSPAYGVGNEDYFIAKTNSNGVGTMCTYYPITPGQINYNLTVGSGINIYPAGGSGYISLTPGSPSALATQICNSTSFEDEQQLSIDPLVYPNPFNSYATVSFDSESTYQIKIFDSMGKLVQEVSVDSGNKIIIHRNNLPSGIYNVVIQTENLQSKSIKLIIE